jgi:hypothetical protein
MHFNDINFLPHSCIHQLISLEIQAASNPLVLQRATSPALKQGPVADAQHAAPGPAQPSAALFSLFVPQVTKVNTTNVQKPRARQHRPFELSLRELPLAGAY